MIAAVAETVNSFGVWKAKMDIKVETVANTVMRSMLMSSRTRYLGLSDREQKEGSRQIIPQ
jgi:hypothetical protein